MYKDPIDLNSYLGLWDNQKGCRLKIEQLSTDEVNVSFIYYRYKYLFYKIVDKPMISASIKKGLGEYEGGLYLGWTRSSSLLFRDITENNQGEFLIPSLCDGIDRLLFCDDTITSFILSRCSRKFPDAFDFRFLAEK